MIKAIESDADSDRRLRRAPYQGFRDVNEAIARRWAETAPTNPKTTPDQEALVSTLTCLAKVWVSWAVGYFYLGSTALADAVFPDGFE